MTRKRPARISKKQKMLRDEATDIWRRFGESLREKAGLPSQASPEFIETLVTIKKKSRTNKPRSAKETM